MTFAGGPVKIVKVQWEHEQGSLNHDSQKGRVSVFVPEPSTLLLLGSGFVGLAVWHLRKQKTGAVYPFSA
jgi:hypothetical protein